MERKIIKNGTFERCPLSKQVKDKKAIFKIGGHMSAKTTIAALMVALMALSVPMVYADSGMGDKDSHQDGGWHHEGKEKMLAKILNLTDDQVKQLKDLHQKQSEAMKSAFKQIKSNREAFEAEIVKASPDMNKITDLQNQLKTAQTQMADDNLNSLLAVKKVLTPEQFAGYMALKKAKKMMMHHRHGFGKAHDGDKDHSDEGQD